MSWKHKKTEVRAPETAGHSKSVRASEKILPETNPEEVVVAAVSEKLLFSELPAPKATITFTDVECDVIVMRNGDEVKAKVSEVTSAVIKYKRCDLVDGPLYTVNKSEVFMIRYPNGTKEVMPEPTTIRNNNNSGGQATIPKQKRKMEPLALIAFIASIVALFMPVLIALIMLLAAVIMSFFALEKIKSRPNERKGKGLAIAAMVIGLVFGLIILLAVGLS